MCACARVFAECCNSSPGVLSLLPAGLRKGSDMLVPRSCFSSLARPHSRPWLTSSSRQLADGKSQLDAGPRAPPDAGIRHSGSVRRCSKFSAALSQGGVAGSSPSIAGGRRSRLHAGIHVPSFVMCVGSHRQRQKHKRAAQGLGLLYREHKLRTPHAEPH